MAEHNRTGTRGESIARKYLETNGWDVIAQNVRFKIGELDLVASKCVPHGFGKATLVAFVEVKTRRSKNDPRGGARAVTSSKRKKIIRAAKLFLQKQPIECAVCRFDVIAVDLHGEKTDLTHYTNAFDGRGRISR